MEKHTGFGLSWAYGNGQHALDEHDRDTLEVILPSSRSQFSFTIFFSITSTQLNISFQGFGWWLFYVPRSIKIMKNVLKKNEKQIFTNILVGQRPFIQYKYVAKRKKIGRKRPLICFYLFIYLLLYFF